MGSSTIIQHRFTVTVGFGADIRNASWLAKWTFTADHLDGLGHVLDSSQSVGSLLAWVEHDLDHAMMLGHNDPSAKEMRDQGQKTFVFGEHPFAIGMTWPTLENTARMLHRAATALVTPPQSLRTRCSRVVVHDGTISSGVYEP